MSTHTTHPTMRVARGTCLALLFVSACTPVVPPGSFVTPRESRLTDETFAQDLARFDSLSGAYSRGGATWLNGARSVALIGLARQAYERNDDGVLTERLVSTAQAVAQGSGSGSVPRTRRPASGAGFSAFLLSASIQPPRPLALSL